MAGRFNGGFLRYEFGGLIFGGAYFRNFTVVSYWRFCLRADVVLFFFSFFSKTSARARELAVSKSPPVYIFYHASYTDFEEKIESEQTNGDSTEATASTRAMPSPGAVSIETPTARLETELCHLPNLYISLVEKEPDHRIITRVRFPPPIT